MTANASRDDDAGGPTTADEPTDGAAAAGGGLGDGVPEIMILPERQRERPTVVLARGSVPPQTRQPSQREQAIEESPFWAPAGQPHPETVDTDADRPASRIGVPPGRRDRPRRPRRPATGLIGLLLLALIAAFFAWVSAEPVWVAVGHAEKGIATVAECAGSGVAERCRGTFTDGSFAVKNVALLGVDVAHRHAGATVPAQMVARDSGQAFVGATGALLHLRWAAGVLLLLLCGLAIAGVTGARRLESARARRRAVLLSLAGPLAMLAGFLALTY
jgi:hypothetical protein